MIFNHVVAQWSEKACFFMSKQALNNPNSKGVWPPLQLVRDGGAATNTAEKSYRINEEHASFPK